MAGAPGADLLEMLAGVMAGRHGFTVRSRPTCRTVVVKWGEHTLFCKLREGERRAARVEWRWLHVMPMLGLNVPQPVAFRKQGARSLVCTAQVRGRPLDALLLEIAREGRLATAQAFLCSVVAPQVRRLHEQGLVFRDLYWNHLYATSLESDGELCFLDVERVFRPRWRRFRWVVKDLAGLLASLPHPVSLGDKLRFLRAYLQDSWSDGWLRRRLIRSIGSKASQIRAHTPKFG